MKKTEAKVDPVTCRAEFDRMCELFRVNLDVSDLDEAKPEDVKVIANVQEMIDEVLRMMSSGSVIVGEDGTPTYHPRSGKALHFNVPTGATLMALETYPGHKNVANMAAAMADMTGEDRGTFSKMTARDFQAAMRLANLFLQDR